MDTWNDIATKLIDDADDSEITPDYRAAKALRTIYPAYGNSDLHTGLIDALSDVLHLCDLAGLDFTQVLTKARGHYRQELHAYGVASHPQLAEAIKRDLT